MKKHKLNTVIWGLMLIAAAAFIILSKTGYLEDVGAVKIVFTVIFGGIALTNLINLNFFGTFLPCGIIFYMYREYMGMENLSGWLILLIVVLVSIGFSLVFSGIKKKKYSQYFGNNTANGDSDNVIDADYVMPEQFDSSDNINIDSKFASTIKYIKKENLSYAKVKNTFGSCDVHFEGSTLLNGTASLVLDNSFGETKIFVPIEWKVKNQVTVVAGAVTEQNASRGGENAPVLVLGGSVHFGEIKVIYC